MSAHPDHSAPESTAGPVLSLRGLTKRFGRRTAVDALSLDVHPGDVFGFLGPNGAGKTTTIRMVVGLIRPDAGSVSIAGHRLAFWRPHALRKIGAIVETPSFYDYLSGRDNLRMLADLSGGCPRARIDEVLERVDLADRARDRVSEYSQGMRQRLAIAAALLPRPALVLLDEPTNGLDPMGIRDVRGLIRGLARDDGLTVFLSSHLLVEVEQVCNRGAILVSGRKLWEGRVAELLERRRRIRLRATPADTALQVVRALGGEVARAPGRRHPGAAATAGAAGAAGAAGVVSGATGAAADAAVHVTGLADEPDVLVARLVAAGCRVTEVAPELPALEEVFMELVEERAR